MRRPLVFGSAIALLCITACSEADDGEDGEAPETAEEVVEEGPTGVALLHRGFDGGDPETDQVLAFHDLETGKVQQSMDLPDGAVDPLAPEVPVHAQFSEDWEYFVFVSDEEGTLTLASLVPPDDAETQPPPSDEDEDDEEGLTYTPVETVAPTEGESFSEPRIHDDRIWYVAVPQEAADGQAPAQGQDPQVLSLPLDSPTGTPNQEGSLASGENGHPSDWTLTPDGELHIRDSVQTQNISGNEGELVVRQTGDSVVNATLTSGGEQWQSFDRGPVWGDGQALLGAEEENVGGAHLVTVNGGQYDSHKLLENEDHPVDQFVPAHDRDGLLLQAGDTWFRVDLENGEPTEPEELFPRFYDASMDGWPLAVRWSQGSDPVSGPSDAPSNGD